MSKRSKRKAARRAQAVALSRSPLSTEVVPPPPPVRDPEKLTQRWTPQPVIARWIAQMVQNELQWSQLDGIRKNAELGLTEQWGDLTRRFLATDDHIFSTYTTYVAAVAGARREVEPAKVDPQYRAIAEEQAKMCEAVIDGLSNFERSIADLIDADFTGYSAEEIQWAIRGDYMWPTALTWIHPDRIRISQRFDPYLWDRGVAIQRARELDIDIGDAVDGLGLPMPRNKYIVHMPRILPNYPQASGIFLSIMRPWFVKNWTTKFMLSGAEIAGNPRMVGTLMENAPDEVRQALYDALVSLSADSVGVVTGGSQVQILDAKLQGTGGIWEMILKRQDAAISKAILGSTLNVEVGDTGGNRSLGESQADMTIAPRWNRSATLVGNTISDQLFRPFLELNRHLWGGHVFTPRLKLHISEDEPNVDQLIVDKGGVSYDELRRSRKLAPWGPEKGGDNIIPAAATPADASIYKAQVDVNPAAPPPNDAPPAVQQPAAAGGAAPRPFKLAASRQWGSTQRSLAERMR